MGPFKERCDNFDGEEWCWKEDGSCGAGGGHDLSSVRFRLALVKWAGMEVVLSITLLAERFRRASR